jgi:16S rRNA (uracil1498-N3)-methyltransferase
MQPGGKLTLFGGGLPGNNAQGGEFDATILRMGRSEVEVQVGHHHALEREAAVEVHLAIGMPANERMDWLVEKATELGVATIQPLVTERTVLRLSGERAERKQQHWQGIAVAAAEQCGRNRVPVVMPVRDFPRWLASVPPQHRWILSLADASQSISFRAKTLFDSQQPVTLLAGPEGGMAPAEEKLAAASGFAPVSLGRRVLRAETAALAALAALTLEQ